MSIEEDIKFHKDKMTEVFMAINNHMHWQIDDYIRKGKITDEMLKTDTYALVKMIVHKNFEHGSGFEPWDKYTKEIYDKLSE